MWNSLSEDIQRTVSAEPLEWLKTALFVNAGYLFGVS